MTTLTTLAITAPAEAGKVCGHCHVEKERSEFHTDPTKSDGLYVWCKACKNTRQNERREVATAFVCEYLLAHPCLDCGETNILTLEFDHVMGGKLGHVSEMAGGGLSVARLAVEIAKCEVVCVDCHTLRTMRRSATWRVAASE